MPDEVRLAGALLIPLVTVLAVTPVAIRVAERIDFHDRPRGYKGHAAPTPYLGGAAVLVGFLLGAVLLSEASTRLGPILLCAAGLWVVGTVDDRWTLGPGLRVAAELVAATALFASGLGWSIFESEAANLALTALWVIGLVNAFNLMDNMDGATSTIAAFSSLGAAVFALALGDVLLAALAVALAGACLGFLPYNLSAPARIFLGDGGSMPIGFVVAATIMALPLGDDIGWHRLLAAGLLAALPLLDTLLVIVSRNRAGVAILSGGRDHLTHRLRTRLPSARAVALSLGVAQAALCLTALGVTQLGDLSTVLAWTVVLCTTAGMVIVLESSSWAPIRPDVSAAATAMARAGVEVDDLASGARVGPTGYEPAPDVEAARRRLGVGWRRRAHPGSDRAVQSGRPGALEMVLLAFVALTCGLSPLIDGFYNLSTWGPIALILLACLFGLIVARPAVPRPAALVAIAGLVLTWGWSLLSTTWAESADQALTEANRWMLYAAFLAILVLLLRDDRLGRILLGFVTGSVVVVGGYVLARMLSGSGPELFAFNRLHDPLGYANGMAAYFLLGIWPLVALCERSRSRAVSAGALGLATMLAALMLLTQTRAVLPAIALSAAVLLLAVPGRLRRTWILLAIGLGLVVLWAPLTAVFAEVNGVRTRPPDAVTREAAALTLAVALAAAVAWFLLDRLADVARRREPLWRGVRVAAASALAVVAVAAVTAVALNDPVNTVADRVDSFRSLSSANDGASRFTSTGGVRYDYWRIAARQFQAEPLRGVGAGNYDRDYFRERRTTEDVRQPHSIVMQALGELGLVGALVLALLVGGVITGLARRTISAREDESSAAMVVAGGGMFISWLVHTSVDWLHVIPGVTGMALCGAAVLLAPWKRNRHEGSARPLVGRVVVASCAVLAAVAAVHLGRSTLGDYNREQGQSALASDPARALEEADQSLALNDEALPAYYLKAAAYARFNRYEDARATLLAATRKEPSDFVTWGLLGDLATRRGDIELAKTYYGRASELNPRNVTLKALASTPAGP